MLQTDPMPTRPVRRFRRTAFGLVGVVIVASGIAAGGDAAFAATDSTFTDVSNDFAAGATSIVLGADLDDPSTRSSTLTLSPNTTAGLTTLDLNGHRLAVAAIQLTTFDSNNSAQGASLKIIDSSSAQTGALVVTQSNPSLPAIEVDSSSTLSVLSGSVSATGAANSSAAVIGGGPTASPLQASGTISFNGSAHVSAVGSGSGAAIGAGSGSSAGSLTFGGSSVVTATTSGSGAAIGDGSGAAGAGIVIANDATVVAHQNSTGSSGAGIGGGASPTGQTAGSVSVGDAAQVTATSAGRGAAIGGGYHGDGGAITISGYSSVTATADATTGEAGIGDGDFATGGGTNVTIQNATTVVAAGGGAGGAGIGGGTNAYGNGSVSIGGTADVTASSTNGPGIGGQKNRNSLSVTIGGTSSVTATGGGHGAGIGGGDSYSSAFPSAGANVSVASGAQLSVGAAQGVSAVGSGTGTNFGSLSNNGTLTVRSGSALVVPVGASASNAGSYVNDGTTTVAGAFANSGTITNAGTIDGTGTLDNQGTVLQNGTLATSSITGNNFDVNYDPQAGSVAGGVTEQRVYAPSVSAAGLSLPTAAPNAVGSFTGWNAATDGTGATLRSGSGIVADFGASGSGDGKPVTVRAYAQYQLSPILPTSGSLAQGVVGTAYSASVAVTSGTAPITYSYTGSLPAGLRVDSSTGAVSGTPTTMGTFTMHLTATNALASATHDYTIEIVPTPITLSVPTTSKGTSWYLAGSTASLRIGNLQTNETYTVTIGGKVAATGKASSNNAFTLKVTIPKSIGDGSQTVSVSGGVHATAATSKILTASVSKALALKLSAKTVKHGKKIVITISKLYAGESARVVVSGKHGKTAVGKATSKGVYVVTLKTGLAKGKYTVTVTGAGTGRKASAKLTVS